MYFLLQCCCCNMSCRVRASLNLKHQMYLQGSYIMSICVSSYMVTHIWLPIYGYPYLYMGNHIRYLPCGIWNWPHHCSSTCIGHRGSFHTIRLPNIHIFLGAFDCVMTPPPSFCFFLLLFLFFLLSLWALTTLALLRLAHLSVNKQGIRMST